MTNFTKSVLMLAVAATVGSQAQAEPLSQARTQTRQIYQAQNSSNVFNSQRARAIEHANSLMFKNDADAASLRGKTATLDQTSALNSLSVLLSRSATSTPRAASSGSIT